MYRSIFKVMFWTCQMLWRQVKTTSAHTDHLLPPTPDTHWRDDPPLRAFSAAFHNPHSTDRAHAEKSFLNLVESNQYQIVYTIFRLIWSHMEFYLVSNLLENGEYNKILVWFKKIQKWFLYVCSYYSFQFRDQNVRSISETTW